tara:strand:- start:1076 stop:1276 length:201 start_codon:yes stop_codon:yes gene_type:complete
VSQRKFRASDIKSALSAFTAAGIKAKALDMLPNGTLRWHFQDLPMDEDVDLDRELAAFEAKHRQGR